MRKMKAQKKIVLTILLFTLLVSKESFCQKLWPNYDYLEIKLSYNHSFGGKKSISVIQFLTDSCYYEYFAPIKPGKDFWRKDELNSTDTISCSYFDLVKAEFNKIKTEDILLHNRNILIMDGFQINLTFSNGSNSVAYQLHSPRKKDEHIEDFKKTASMMLTLVGTSWNQWIK